MSETLPTGQLSNVPWRRSGVKYTNNEAYFDVIEEVDAIIDKNGSTVSAEIHGYVSIIFRSWRNWDKNHIIALKDWLSREAHRYARSDYVFYEPADIRRYELPPLCALQEVIPNYLGGGAAAAERDLFSKLNTSPKILSGGKQSAFCPSFHPTATSASCRTSLEARM